MTQESAFAAPFFRGQMALLLLLDDSKAWAFASTGGETFFVSCS